MKKINKSNILSKGYQNWLESLGENEHPNYDDNKTKKEYYIDIKMSLLHCQNALCAYTEEALCDPNYISISNWDDEKYAKELSQKEKGSIKGDLEHFDESLKPKFAFLWDNLFVVDTHNNCRIKGTKSIKNILKPDAQHYDPTKYLEFDFDTGVFIPNHNLSIKDKEDVQYMIDTLGLNCVEYVRKRQLEEWRERVELGLVVKPYRFITAWNMTLSQLQVANKQ